MRDDAGVAQELDRLRGGEVTQVPEWVDPTEDSVARAFVATNAGRFIYDHTAESWYVWKDARWAQDVRSSVFHCAREFARAVRAKLTDPPVALARIAFTAAVERASRADPKMAVSHEIWDIDPWLLGVPGGAIDLRTGSFLPPQPDRYISRQTSVAPASPGITAPQWLAFLDSATGHDKELQGFLQRLAGYVLTGIVTEEVLTFIYGGGGNGKGVFISTLTGILAEYAVAVPIDVFTATTRLNLEYYRAQMAGARLITASETEAHAAWAESQIKEMTGNEAPLSARQPYGQPFTFRPQFKIVLVGNHAPKLKGRTPAMERRLRIAPFNHIPEKPDPELKDRLRGEWPAILRWALDGCLAWQQDRLGTAAVITTATSAYFEQQDAFRRWIEDRCILHDPLEIRPSALQADFTLWARENGEETVTPAEFNEMIDRMPKLKRGRSNGVRWVRGIGLKVPAKSNSAGSAGE
jgi:putative DNA primase/helicase